MSSTLLRSFGILFTITYGGVKAESTQSQRYELEAMLQKDHSKPPFYHTGNQTKVTITAHMTQMRLIDTSESDFTFYYYQIWNDPRLKFPFGNKSDFDGKTYHVVRRKYFENIWLAESYIENELRSHIHDSSMSNRFVWLLPDGTVVYCMRMTVGLSCDLKGVLFPNGLFDCVMKFRILVDSSCLQLLIHIHFNFATNAVRLFLPSSFIVLVGWLSFWVERSEVSSRVKLGTLCLLAMITEQVGTKLLLPVKFMISSVEVWFVMSLTFVVVAMFEYTFVHAVDVFQDKVKRQEEMKKKIRTQTGGIGDPQNIKQRSNVDLIDMNTSSQDGSASEESTGNRNGDLMKSFGAKYIMRVQTGVVEKYFRILYPVAYFFSQLLFWTIYLNYKEVYE